MESLRIDTGVKRVMINDDPNRVIVFNPSDVAFAERFYRLIGEFQDKQAEYQRRAEELEQNAVVNENGIPSNLAESLALLREACEFLRAKIDDLFGAGTSEKVFGDALSLDAFEQFFEGITPFVQTARSNKMTRYVSQKVSGRVMK